MAGERISSLDAISTALAPTSAGGSRITRAEYDAIKDAMPLFPRLARPLMFAGSEAQMKVYDAVASSDTYESFLTAYGQRAGGMGTWKNQ